MSLTIHIVVSRRPAQITSSGLTLRREQSEQRSCLSVRQPLPADRPPLQALPTRSTPALSWGRSTGPDDIDHISSVWPTNHSKRVFL